MDLVGCRLANQHISEKRFTKPEEIVKWQGAVQAQDYQGGLWGVGLRLPGSTAHDIEKAISSRKIVRTWPMRGTLHFVPAEDARWMLKLMGERVIKKIDTYYRHWGLTEAALKKAEAIITRALEGKQLTRPELRAALEKGGVDASGQAGYHILGHVALRGIICFGERREKQQTFVLFDEWVKKSRKLEGDKALAEIAKRYFASHGPATIQDFMWWTGLTSKEAKKGVELAGLQSEKSNGKEYWFRSLAPVANSGAHLLPSYDEYLIAYKDRSAMLSEYKPNAAFFNTIISSGIVVGGWKKVTGRNKVAVKASFARPPSSREKSAVEAASERYGKFLGVPVTIS